MMFAGSSVSVWKPLATRTDGDTTSVGPAPVRSPSSRSASHRLTVDTGYQAGRGARRRVGTGQRPCVTSTVDVHRWTARVAACH
jgi:hypothetical protein